MNSETELENVEIGNFVLQLDKETATAIRNGEDEEMDTLVPYPKIRGPKNPLKLKLQLPQSPFDIIVSQQSLPSSKHQCYFPMVDVSKKFEESLETCRKKRKQKKIIKAIEKVTISKQMSQNIIESYRKSQTTDSRNRERCTSESVETKESNSLRNRRASELVDQLLLDIYGRTNFCPDKIFETEYGSSTSFKSIHDKFDEKMQFSRLVLKDVTELCILIGALKDRVPYAGNLLVKQLKKRDALKSKQEKLCNVITAHLHAYSDKRSEDTSMRFSPSPIPGDSGFNQWRDAMKMVAKLPGGIPPEFRKKLWIALAEKHLQSKGVNWTQTEKLCFNEWSNPDDSELGIQIVKDLHRTGCSLFCGAAGQENQALLKRVLLAYARWNKTVGYCQGFNMLAALILQVMDKNETDSVKVMIYLIEGVLPESYFANNLRGLSVDMIVFRDLLKMRLPILSKHLEALQNDARDGNSYEPPLTNVFTMQWFLTLFCNCLPQATVLRVWDLIFLEGNEILLRTAIAIWEKLSDRILAVNSADEFYSIMGVLTREMLEFGLVDSNTLIKSIVAIGTCSELNEMRDKYLYNITPWTQSVQTAARKGFKLFYSDDDEVESDYDEKAAVTAAYGISIGRKKEKQPNTKEGTVIQPYAYGHPDRERLALDISALKKQYAKLRERQRQAHIILQAACARQPMGQNSNTPPIAMNHLLLGKSAIVNSRGRRLGPPKGSIPPARTKKQEPAKKKDTVVTGETIHWKDTAKFRRRQSTAEDTDTSQETFIPESDSSSYSEDDASSTSTELCDEPNRMSDFDSDEKTSERKTVKHLQNNLIVNKSPDNSILPTETMDSSKNLGEFSCSEVVDIQNEVGEMISDICELKYDDTVKHDSDKKISERKTVKYLENNLNVDRSPNNSKLLTETMDSDKILGEFSCSEVIDIQNEVGEMISGICELKFDDTVQHDCDKKISERKTVKYLENNLIVDRSSDKSKLLTETMDSGKNVGEFSCSEVIDIQNEVGEIMSDICELKFDAVEQLKNSDFSEFGDFKSSDIQLQHTNTTSSDDNSLFNNTKDSGNNKSLATEITDYNNTTQSAICSNILSPKINEDISANICDISSDSNNKTFAINIEQHQNTFSTDLITIKSPKNELNINEIIDERKNNDNFDTFLQEQINILKENNRITSPNDETTSFRHFDDKLRRHKSYEDTTKSQLEKSVICKQNSFDISSLPIIETSLWKPYKIEEESPRDETPTEIPKEIHSKLKKQTSIDLLQVEDKRLEAGRRNSERALKIIQENSLILHRILQQQKSSEKEESEDELSRSPISRTFLRSESLLSKDEKTDEERSSKDGDEELESGVESFSVSPALLDEESDRSLKRDQFDDEDTLIISKTNTEYSYIHHNTSNIVSQTKYDIASNIIDYSKDNLAQNSDENTSYRFSYKYQDDSDDKLDFKSNKNEEIILETDTTDLKSKEIDVSYDSKHEELLTFLNSSPNVFPVQKTNEDLMIEACHDDKPVFKYSDDLVSASNLADKLDLDKLELDKFSPNVSATQKTNESLMIEVCPDEKAVFKYSDDLISSSNFDDKLDLDKLEQDKLKQAKLELDKFSPNISAAQETNESLMNEVCHEERPVFKYSNDLVSASKFDDKLQQTKLELDKLERDKFSPNVSAVKSNEDLMIEVCPEEKTIFKYSDDLVSASNLNGKLDVDKLELDKLELNKFSSNVSAVQKTNEDLRIAVCHEGKSVFKYSDDLVSESNLNDKLELNKLELDELEQNKLEQSKNTDIIFEETPKENPVSNYSIDLSSAANLKSDDKYKKLMFEESPEEKSKLSAGSSSPTKLKLNNKLDQRNIDLRFKERPETAIQYSVDISPLNLKSDTNLDQARNTSLIFDESSKEKTTFKYSKDVCLNSTNESKLGRNNIIISDETPKENPIFQYSEDSFTSSKLQSNNVTDLMFDETPEEKKSTNYSNYLSAYLKSEENLSETASKAEMKSYLRDSIEDIFKTSTVQEDVYKYSTASKPFYAENVSSYSQNIASSYSKESSSRYKYHLREDNDDNISKYLQSDSKMGEFTCKSTLEDQTSSDFSYKYNLGSPEYTQNTNIANTSSYSQSHFESSSVNTIKPDIDDANNDKDNKLLQSNITKAEYNKSNLSINLKPSNFDDSPETSSPKNLSCLQFTSFQTDIPCTSKSIQFSPICTKTNNTSSPTKTTPKYFNFPTLSPPRRSVKSPLSPNRTFSPFPVQPTTRQPKELGVKLGMYKDLSPLKSPTK